MYNGNGQRIRKTEADDTINYYYQGANVLYTTEGTGALSAQNLVGISENTIATTRGTGDSEAYYVYNKDIRESTTNLVDSSGVSEVSYEYTDYGETEITGDEDFYNEICYTGGIYDEETGLYYLNAKYYDPENGRFISQDTYRGEVNDPGQWHLYAYCANNPINYVDPSGHKYGNSFTTKNNAAKDFGKTINPKSIEEDREYSSVIYKKKFRIRVQRKRIWVIRFTYIKPVKGSQHGAIVPNPPEEKKILGILHTHGAYSPGYDNENFSAADKSAAEKYGCVIYVVTLGGKLKKYNPKTRITTIISWNMPRDPKSPN